MNTRQLHKTNEHYASQFGNGMDQRSLQLLSGIDTVDELDEIENELSAGEYDCAEAILENR
jgi:hypothetical protein